MATTTIKSNDGNTLSIDSTGAAKATGTFTIAGPVGVAGTEVLVYNEVTAIASEVETTLATYTAPGTAYLLLASGSGQNIGQLVIYKNGSPIDKNYLSYTQFNAMFDYRTDNSNAPGLPLAQGDVIAVKYTNSSQSSCNGNAKIQVLETS